MKSSRGLLLGPLGVVEDGTHAEELVRRALVALVVHFNAGILQPVGQLFTLGPERIDLGRDHRRPRQSLYVGVHEVDQLVLPIGWAAEILLEEPLHHGLVERLCVGILQIGGRVQVVAGDGIDQHLVERHLGATVSGHHRHCCGEVAPRALAHYGYFRGISLQSFGIGQRPAVRGEGVLMRGGKLVLRSLSVVGRDHDGIGEIGERAGRSVVGVQICDHPATAVIVDHDRKWAWAFRGVDPNGYRPACTRNRPVGHIPYRLRSGALPLLLQ